MFICMQLFTISVYIIYFLIIIILVTISIIIYPSFYALSGILEFKWFLLLNLLNPRRGTLQTSKKSITQSEESNRNVIDSMVM